ncbi:MAG: DEAD/DEAH box helicase [Planctomycetes bacterium]|nr:DEAD/DEAH box helicase [Planctomycetota bacterium]
MYSLAPHISPRKWQRAALGAWVSNGHHGIVKVVTGGGKTIFAELCIIEFLQRHPDGRVLIVVPTLALLDQWHVSLQDEAGVPLEDIAAWSGRGRPKLPLRINIAVINTARKLKAVFSALPSVMLIVDECHRAASPENVKALGGNFSSTLGMSATPEREYDAGLEEALIPQLGKIVFQYLLEDAAADGVLAPFELCNVKVPLLGDEQDAYDKLSKRVAKLVRRAKTDPDTAEALKHLLLRRARVVAGATMRIPVAAKIAEKARGARTLIFHEDIRSAEAIRASLDERGCSVTIYHSRLGPALRRQNLLLFRRGVYDILVACRALDEGLNVPETAVAVIASATASARQRIQRLGRVLRPAPNKSHAIVYTLYATEPEEQRLREEENTLRSVERITWLVASGTDG